MPPRQSQPGAPDSTRIGNHVQRYTNGLTHKDSAQAISTDSSSASSTTGSRSPAVPGGRPTGAGRSATGYAAPESSPQAVGVDGNPISGGISESDVKKLFALFDANYLGFLSTRLSEKKQYEATVRAWHRRLYLYPLPRIQMAYHRAMKEFPKFPPTLEQFVSLVSSREAMHQPFASRSLDKPRSADVARKHIDDARRILGMPDSPHRPRS